MPVADPALFTCPACGSGYRWRTETSGRKAQCARCGAIIRVPESPGTPGVLLAAKPSGRANHLPAPADPAKPHGAPEDPLPALVDDDVPFNPLDDEPEDKSGETDYALAEVLEDEPPQDVQMAPPLPPPPPITKATLTEETVDVVDADNGGGGDYELAGAPETESIEPVKMTPAAAALGSMPGRCPNCGMNLKPGAVLCLNCGYHTSQGAKIETQVIAPDPVTESSVQRIPGVTVVAEAEAHPSTPVALSGHAVGQAMAEIERQRRDKQESEDHRSYMWREIYIPLAMIVAGLLLILVSTRFIMWIQKPAPPSATAAAAAAALQNLSSATGTPAPAVVPMPTPPPVPTPTAQRVIALAGQAAYILVQIPFLFMGLLLVGHLFGTAFGPIVAGTVKLVALAVVADAVGFLVLTVLSQLAEGTPIWGADMIYFSVTFSAFWAISSFLFELEYKEMLVLYCFSLLMPVILVMIALTYVL